MASMSVLWADDDFVLGIVVQAGRYGTRAKDGRAGVLTLECDPLHVIVQGNPTALDNGAALFESREHHVEDRALAGAESAH